MPIYGPLDMPEGEAGDVAFVKMNARLRPDQLPPGDVAESVNGRMGVDGAWQPRKGIDALGSTISSAATGLTVPWYAYGSRSISSATRSTITVTVTTSSAHGFTTGTLVGIAGLTGSVDPNGNRSITVSSSTVFTFTIAGATGSETYGGTGTAGAPFVDDDANNGAYGSCLFSNPGGSNAQYIIIATNTKAVAVALATGTQTDISYPAALTISSSVEMCQAFDKVFIFRNGATALSWDGVLTGSPAFAKVGNGTYTAPAYLDAANNSVAVDGVITVTATAHGLAVGTQIYCVDNGSTVIPEGGPYTIATVPGVNSFTLNIQTPDFSATTVVWSKRISSGMGFTYMPAPPWAVYHNRRMFCPYFYTTSGSSGSETVTDRGVRDELVISDIGDTDTYDKLKNSLRVTAGTADYLVGLHPFTTEQVVAFNRNSIHLINDVGGDVGDISITLITREVGALARKSILQVGNLILFLSDNGVYATTFADLYNLRGSDVPLSEPIKPWIDRINPSYASGCVAAYHDNRYYLAVPLDDSIVNNAIFVYNFLNRGWESIDVVDREGWNVTNLLTGQPSQRNKLYAINALGGVHVYDERTDDSDRLFLNPGIAASTFTMSPTSYVITRGYNLGTMERKAWSVSEFHVESSEANTSTGTLAVIAENADSETDIATISGLLGAPLAVSEDAILRARIGNKRAYSLQVKLTPTTGRPKLRATRSSATITAQSVTQTT